MKMDTDNQGTWTIHSQDNEEEKFFTIFFDALDAKWGGHHLRINVPGVSLDEILANLGLSENQTQRKLG